MTNAEVKEWLKNHVCTSRDEVLKATSREVDESGKKKRERKPMKSNSSIVAKALNAKAKNSTPDEDKVVQSFLSEFQRIERSAEENISEQKERVEYWIDHEILFSIRLFRQRAQKRDIIQRPEMKNILSKLDKIEARLKSFVSAVKRA